MCTALQLGGDVEQPWLISKYDIIHKTGNAECITMPPEEDQAMAIGNTHTHTHKLVKIGFAVLKI